MQIEPVLSRHVIRECVTYKAANMSDAFYLGQIFGMLCSPNSEIHFKPKCTLFRSWSHVLMAFLSVWPETRSPLRWKSERDYLTPTCLAMILCDDLHLMVMCRRRAKFSMSSKWCRKGKARGKASADGWCIEISRAFDGAPSSLEEKKTLQNRERYI